MSLAKFKHLLASIVAVGIAAVAVLLTLPCLPFVWLWAVLVQGDDQA